MPQSEFEAWRDANGIGAISAPYYLYWVTGKRKKTLKGVVMGVQESFFRDGSRRQWCVIYRDLTEGTWHTVLVQGS